MGKYDALKGKLPAFQQEQTFQTKVDEAKEKYKNLEVEDLAREFKLSKMEKWKHEDFVTLSNIHIEALSQMILASFEEKGLQKMQLISGETCFQETRVGGKTFDEEALNKFLDKNKMKNMRKLPAATRDGMNRERLLAGKPPLPGTECFLKTTIKMSGVGSSEQE